MSAFDDARTSRQPFVLVVVRRLFEWLLVLLVLATVAGVVAMAALLYGERDFSARVYPNISVRGVPIGGLSISQARQAIERHYAAFLQNPVELRYNEQRWHPSAAELGVRLQVDTAVEQAFAIGRGDARIENARTAAAVWEQGVDLPLGLELDQAAMQQYLVGLAAQIESPPADADVGLVGAEIVLAPEAWGMQLLIDQTLSEITAATQELATQPVALRTRTLEPRLRDSDLASVVVDLHTLLDEPIVLESSVPGCAEPCRWLWAPARIAEWITLRRGVDQQGKPTRSLSIDPALIRTALLPIAAELRQEGTLPRVAWNDGALQIVQPGGQGIGLDADQTMAQIDAALWGGPRVVALPLVALPPPVTDTNLASLGISAQVGLGVSSFARSEQYRITNIVAGARQMNGVLIPPGASFSFNDNLGPVTAEQGFVEGLAIIENRTQKEWGGGLCQVSTTVFRAAFWGGLPIVERHEHSFRIGWYEELGEPPGLDAAIFTGVYDMRFRNDSGGWLLMQSYVDQQRQLLSIALYGAPSDRAVSMDHRVLERTPAPTEPVYVDDPALPAGSVKKTDTARGGLRADVYRTVVAGGQVISNDTFATTFKPWPDIYVRGTGS